MSERGCGDAQGVAGEAVELFQLAALLVGNETEAAALVEDVVNESDIDPCLDYKTMRRTARMSVLQSAVALLRRQQPGAFAAPSASELTGSCIDNDDLSASGVSQAQLGEWLAGAGRTDLRRWLEQLPTAQRTVFVQRAVLGQDSDTAALVLRELTADSEGPGWTPEMVGETFRMALCSLANRFAHSAASAGHTVVAAGA